MWLLCGTENCEDLSFQVVMAIMIVNNILSFTFLICLIKYSKEKNLTGKSRFTLERMVKISAILDLAFVAIPMGAITVIDVSC